MPMPMPIAINLDVAGSPKRGELSELSASNRDLSQRQYSPSSPARPYAIDIPPLLRDCVQNLIVDTHDFRHQFFAPDRFAAQTNAHSFPFIFYFFA